MLLSALQTPVVVAIIIVVAVQYAFALFCLLKLAYLDISKRDYVLWNLFILLVFFIGGIAFLVYYYKVGKNKRIPPYVAEADSTQTAENTADEQNIETEAASDEKTEASDEPTDNDK